MDDGPTPPTPAETRPVFVDASGRRGRWARRAGWAISALLVGYLVLVGAALVGPSQLSRFALPGLGPILPGPGAAALDDGAGARDAPGAVLEATRRPSPSGSPTPARRTPVTASPPPTAPRTTAPAVTASGPGRSDEAPGRVSPSPSPTASVSASPSPSTGDTRRSTRAPSPKPKPSRSPR